VGDCVFCRPADELVLWRGEKCRVLAADEPGYPGFCRVVWSEHVAEMTDLAPEERSHLMGVVFGVETVLREVLSPAKVNLASLGNRVPHLHWHVIARFPDDPTFPDAVWAAPRRPPREASGGQWEALRAALADRLPTGGPPCPD
jgi:diadenosine tetraphosphate (Ap4A) HIT family hydrolase